MQCEGRAFFRDAISNNDRSSDAVQDPKSALGRDDIEIL